jgi:hypothetical protein
MHGSHLTFHSVIWRVLSPLLFLEAVDSCSHVLVQCRYGQQCGECCCGAGGCANSERSVVCEHSTCSVETCVSCCSMPKKPTGNRNVIYFHYSNHGHFNYFSFFVTWLIFCPLLPDIHKCSFLSNFPAFSRLSVWKHVRSSFNVNRSMKHGWNDTDEGKQKQSEKHDRSCT